MVATTATNAPATMQQRISRQYCPRMRRPASPSSIAPSISTARRRSRRALLADESRFPFHGEVRAFVSSDDRNSTPPPSTPKSFHRQGRARSDARRPKSGCGPGLRQWVGGPIDEGAIPPPALVDRVVVTRLTDDEDGGLMSTAVIAGG